MDPDANWEEQKRIREWQRDGKALEGDSRRLRELRMALNEWIRNGGFPPKEWVTGKPRT